MVALINEGYAPLKTQIKERLDDEGVVLLEQFLMSPTVLFEKLISLPHTRSFHPLTHSWSTLCGEELDSLLLPIRKWLFELTSEKFHAELLVFKKGDYSLLNDEVPGESGIVAFLEVTPEWDPAWGGYFALGTQVMPLPPAAILIASLDDARWFIKKLNHYAKEKVFIVLRSA